ncbi:MAG TPA: hypothetical protein VK874_16715, partial [Gaiellaceae bacterium]|nr:hypothetical protein [Gaiellaceae bacterium]
MRRPLVRALAGACGALDAVTHRPLALRLVPGVRRCRLASLSRRLDERWGTGVWPDGVAHPVPLLPCAACYRRPAVRSVTDEEGWLRRHPVELCEWCELETTRFESAEEFVRQLALAR